ncbi:MAG: hypothetical protein H6867_06040 [Rhodospirillales bacterium]|nr:hypothetical protein [Rhodospirillales bacterium]MCB9995089.1 hypothetical protein [Rhodospirillales bacterium]
MANWLLEVRGEYMGRDSLAEIFTALSCEQMNTKPQAQQGNTWLVAVKGPEDLDKTCPLYPRGVVGIHPRPEK